MKTPIALLMFNRPDTTARVFESIRQAQPAKLSFPLQHSPFVIRDTQADRYSHNASKKLPRLMQIVTNPVKFKQVVSNYLAQRGINN